MVYKMFDLHKINPLYILVKYLGNCSLEEIASRGSYSGQLNHFLFEEIVL
jgi:hypothetical protein